ncbi:MAG: winged helix-turn-helix domain-containing protein [Methanothrix sp.]|nr:winged helix-turn-helix domain-containing protein [Methanothrix sp.]
MAAPFEGLFGDTSELRVIQFLLPLKGLEFNISELARNTGISRQTMISITKKLTKWNVLKLTSRHGNANYYSINEDSGFVEAFENLNNCIIEQMLGAEELDRIANYAFDHPQVSSVAPKSSNSGYIVVEGGETSANARLHLSPTNRLDRSYYNETSDNSKLGVDLRRSYAVAA